MRWIEGRGSREWHWVIGGKYLAQPVSRPVSCSWSLWPVGRVSDTGLWKLELFQLSSQVSRTFRWTSQKQSCCKASSRCLVAGNDTRATVLIRSPPWTSLPTRPQRPTAVMAEGDAEMLGHCSVEVLCQGSGVHSANKRNAFTFPCNRGMPLTTGGGKEEGFSSCKTLVS